MKLQQQVSLLLFAISLVFIAIGCDSSSNNNFSGASSTQIIPSSQESPASSNDLRPIANSISPNNGSSLGGTQITITGSNFDASAVVCFGETAASNVQITDSAITCDSPPGTPEATVNIKVIHSNGQIAILGSAFTYFLVVPSIAQIAPTQGTPNGGTAVTITGNDFLPQAQVFFGENLASNIVITPTQITCQTPAGTPSSTVEVTVENINGATDTLPSAFNYLPLTITGVAPSLGIPDETTSVTISGTGFEANPLVEFGGVPPSNIVFVNDTTITCDVPSGVANSSLDVFVQNQNGDTFTLSNAFSYPFSISSISPGNGTFVGGTAITINGEGFGASSQVFFDGTNLATNIVVVDQNTITCNSPLGTSGALVEIAVENSNSERATLAGSFRYALVVTNDLDSGVGSLRQAIIDAAPDETILFESSLAGAIITLTTGELLVNKNLNILGLAATPLAIDGNASSRIFNISSGFTFTLSDFILSNGFATDYGGGIRNFGTTILANCVISNSSAFYGGAFVNHSSGELTLTDCTISDNSAIRDGGAIFNDGIATIINCTISNNMTTDPGFSFGGGVYTTSNGTTTLTDCTISDNSAFTGGAIFVRPSGELTLTDCTISNNSTSRSGGGVFNSGIATLTNCTISDNMTTDSDPSFGGGVYTTSNGTTTLTNCTISNNSAFRDGGGVFNDGIATLTNCTISDNMTTDPTFSFGGGVYTNPNGATTLTNCTISNNSANNEGGGIFVWLGTVTLTNCTISNNSTSIRGGGYSYNAGTIIFSNCIIAGNTSPSNPDGNGGITSLGYNLIGDGTGSTGFTAPGDQVGTAGSPIDPMLGPLQDNGGPTETHALLLGSPAIDAGEPASTLIEDQRGFSRPSGIAIDIGAYEF